MWEPGDRIFLFGFSRGAYTVRCLAAVLSFCGVPTVADGKTPLFRDPDSTKRIAREAVKKVYQHVGSPKDKKFVEQRKALALRFRRKYGSEAVDGGPNVNPYFIGVFDTVASLGSYLISATMLAAALAVIALLSWARSFLLLPFTVAFWSLIGIAAIVVSIWYAAAHLRFATGLEGYSFWETLHFTSPKMKFYDPHLDNAVRYARHAMSIDENRADFERVAWGSSANPGPPRKPSDPDWLQQVWFAGNHSDVGGSYPENEARLSDIALEWMAHAAENLPDEATPTGFGIKLNRQLLQLRPDPAGPQHDAREPGYLWGRLKWKLGLREIRSDAVLHSSVFKRFAADKVLHYYEAKAYRPGNLSKHGKLEEYYGQGLQEPLAPA